MICATAIASAKAPGANFNIILSELNVVGDDTKFLFDSADF